MAIEMTDRMKARMEPSRAWLKEASANTDAQVIDILRERKVSILTIMRELSAAQSLFSAGDGEWCIHQVGRHMIQENKNAAGLMQMLAAGKQVDAKGRPGYVPEGPDEFGAVCDKLERSFERLVKSFESIADKYPELSATYDHPYFGAFDAREWFIFSLLHANIHIEQIERITQAEGFPVN